jgi:hypothetical protein
MQHYPQRQSSDRNLLPRNRLPVHCLAVRNKIRGWLGEQPWRGVGPLVRGLDPILLIAIAVGIILRVWGFGANPPGLNQDEASTAYDAFSLVRHGVDRHGVRFPVVLVSWGSGMYALASYLEAPFIWLLGLKVWVARLPFLFAGIASLPLFFRLLLATTNRRTARIGVVLLALCPWHIMISRWGLDSNLLPFVFLVAAVLLVGSVARPRRLIGAAFCCGLALYAYGTAYLVVPVFVTIILADGLARRLWPARMVLWAAGTFALVALPVGLFVAINSFGWSSIRTPIFSIPHLTGVPRFSSMGNLNMLSLDFFRQAWTNLVKGAAMFRAQGDGQIWNAVPGYGILYEFSPFLAVAGVALLADRNLRRDRDASFPLLAWSMAALVLTAFVEPNINRLNVAMLPFVFCVAIAASLLSAYRSLAVLLCVLLAGSFAGFVGTYFGSYRDAAAGSFYASFGEAIQYASEQTKDEICITDEVNMPYIYVLFYNQEDSLLFAKTARYENPGDSFERVSSFGRYRFGVGACANSATAVVATPAEAGKLGRDRFTVKEFERYTVLVRR